MTTKTGKMFYGWTLLFVLGLIYAIIIGFNFYGTPILFPYMIEEFGWSRTNLSLGIMVAMLVMGLAAPIAVWSIKKIGCRMTIVVGGVVGSTGFVLMPFVKEAYQYILIFGLCIGLGLALTITIPVQTVITQWFDKRRGTAFGLVMGGGALGGFVASPIITAIVSYNPENWEMVWLYMAAVMMLASVLSFIFVRNTPSDLGQWPDGIDPNDHQTSLKKRPSNVYKTTYGWKLHEALRTPQFWLLTLATVGSLFIWQILITQGPLHLADRGFTAAQYGLIYGSAIGLSILGRSGGGFLMDLVEPRILFLVAIIFTMIGSILFWHVTPGNRLTFLYPLFSGVAFGTIMVALPTIIGNYWGNSAFAPVYGVIMPILAVSNSVAAPVSALIYDAEGSYFTIIVMCWVLLVIAFLAMLLSKPPKPKAEVLSESASGASSN